VITGDTSFSSATSEESFLEREREVMRSLAADAVSAEMPKEGSKGGIERKKRREERGRREGEVG
jgi:hypothetical protein